MTDAKVYYVGTHQEVAHHARPIAERVDLAIVDVAEALERAIPGDLCIFFNEYFERFRSACEKLKARGCSTLYAIDGILEWRNSWEFSPGSVAVNPMRPVLSDKVACVGRSQARILESWGNLGKCELVGVPRFDSLVARTARPRPNSGTVKVLVLTAKTPFFTTVQRERVLQSLRDLKDWFAARSIYDGVRLEPGWRLTLGLDSDLGITNELRDTTGSDLAEVLQRSDAVIATPSTAMLEAMLLGIPVALLDYNNCPHYVPAAWTITARQHLDQVIPEMMRPAEAKLLLQDTILHDALECRSPAVPRMVRLVEEMVRIGRACRARGEPIRFPRRILSDEQDDHHLPEERFDLRRLYPDHPVFANLDRAALQAELQQLHFELGLRQKGFEQQLAEAERRLQYLQHCDKALSLRIGRALGAPLRWLVETLFSAKQAAPKSRDAP